MENHKSMVPNFSMSELFRLAFAEPMVMTTIATIITVQWKMPKKVKSRFAIDASKWVK